MSREIEELRRKLFASSPADSVFQGVVTQVDEEEFTCQIRRDDAVDYFDVRLRALINPDLQGIALIPKLQSVVLVCRIGNSNELFVCQYTEIDKIVFTGGDASLTFDQDKLELSKGEKLSILLDADSLTIRADKATIRATAKGLTFAKGSSGLKKTLDDLLKAIGKLTVTTGVGPSGPPINISDFMQIQTDLSNYLEE